MEDFKKIAEEQLRRPWATQVMIEIDRNVKVGTIAALVDLRSQILELRERITRLEGR